MKTNLKWIEQSWRAWLESDVGRKVVQHPSTIKQHSEHVAKLFAAFCVENLSIDGLLTSSTDLVDEDDTEG